MPAKGIPKRVMLTLRENPIRHQSVVVHDKIYYLIIDMDSGSKFCFTEVLPLPALYRIKLSKKTDNYLAAREAFLNPQKQKKK